MACEVFLKFSKGYQIVEISPFINVWAQVNILLQSYCWNLCFMFLKYFVAAQAEMKYRRNTSFADVCSTELALTAQLIDRIDKMVDHLK